ncbi:MAG: hypothetical protein Q9208_008487 [Pyrenodesmia sp. 3 TL-2023]
MAEVMTAVAAATRQLPLLVESESGGTSLAAWQRLQKHELLGLEREEQPVPTSDETKESTLPSPTGSNGRLLGEEEVVSGQPRSPTFIRRYLDFRERLKSLIPKLTERQTASVTRTEAFTTRPFPSWDPISLDLKRSGQPSPVASSDSKVDDIINSIQAGEWSFTLSNETPEIDPIERKTSESSTPVTLRTPFADSPAPKLQTRAVKRFGKRKRSSPFPIYRCDGTFSTVEEIKQLLEKIKQLLENHALQATDEPYITPGPLTTQRTLSKWKRGLSGFVNGRRVSALADTGSRRNAISQAFAQDMNLRMKPSTSKFIVGNSNIISSIGTVSFDWAFSESPGNLMKIVCDVIPNCSYQIILGSRFLAATQTLSKYRRRLTECFFSRSKVLQMNFLGDDCERLLGQIGSDTEAFAVTAVPDTGAEGNIMNHSFALAHGLCIRKGTPHRNILQFADGTYQETIGQVETYWTFESGERIPVTFEVLENCCTDIILGESILYDHNVFEDHSSSIVVVGSNSDAYHLAPFDFANKWQLSWTSIMERFKKERTSGLGSSTTSSSRIEETRREARRQEDWDHQFSFGETASEAEKAAEAQKRADFKSRLRASPQAPLGSGPQQANVYHVPSIPTAPNRTRPPRP